MDIPEIIIGAILGILIEHGMIWSYQKSKAFQKKRLLKKRLGKNTELKGYRSLDSGIPFYKDRNIKFKLSLKEFYVDIPEEFSKTLQEHNFSSHGAVILKPELRIDEKRIKECSIEASRLFASELNEGIPRFNGLLFGVFKILSNRTPDEEESTLDIELYKTDYFTHRTMSIYYSKYRTDIGLSLENIIDLNRYSEFLTSFGLSNFILFNRGYGDEILLTRRQKTMIRYDRKWHYSMNEAFSLKDIDAYGNPSLEACLLRGLREELGLNECFKSNLSFWFLDFIANPSSIEVGIFSVTRLEFTDVFTFNDLMQLYGIAQDSNLETSKVKALPIRDIEVFIKENIQDISEPCVGSLNSLLARHKSGYFDII